MSVDPAPTFSRIGHLPVAEIARLVSLHRVSLGAAHALNNAFTAILGETSLLLGTRKDDPELQEACAVIRDEVERCARVTKALLSRRTPNSLRTEVDLARLVRESAGLLRDTLSRRIELRIELPDDLVLIRGSASELEAMILTLVQHICDLIPGAARVRIAAGPGDRPREARLEVELSSRDLPRDAVAQVLDPPPTAGLAERAAVAAVRSLAADYGARVEGLPPAADSAGVRISFPALDPED